MCFNFSKVDTKIEIAGSCSKNVFNFMKTARVVYYFVFESVMKENASYFPFLSALDTVIIVYFSHCNRRVLVSCHSFNLYFLND